MSKARQLADNGAATPNRNMVINGAMNVAQRATSVTGIGAADGYFTVDRWHLNTVAASAGRLTMTQAADGPAGISANCIKLDCTTADTSIAAGEALILEQRIEGQNLQRMAKGLAEAKEVTISFYVKASAAFNFVVELYDADHDRQISKLYATTTDWVRHEFTIPADVDGGDQPLDDDNATSLLLDFWLHAGSTYTSGTLNTASWANATAGNLAAGISSFFSSTDNNFFITGVQLEVGSSATPFEHEEISTTLAKCQRYFIRTGGETAFERFAVGANESATRASGLFYYPTTMRAVPTLTTSGTTTVFAGGALTNTNATSIANASTKVASIIFDVASGLTTGQGAILLSNNDSDTRVLYDAEL